MFLPCTSLHFFKASKPQAAHLYPWSISPTRYCEAHHRNHHSSRVRRDQDCVDRPRSFSAIITELYLPSIISKQTLLLPLRGWCKWFWMPGLGSRLSTCCPTKWSNNWWYSQHTSVNQTPTSCVPVASPGLKPKKGGGVWRADASARAAKPINTATPGMGETSMC